MPNLINFPAHLVMATSTVTPRALSSGRSSSIQAHAKDPFPAAAASCCGGWRDRARDQGTRRMPCAVPRRRLLPRDSLATEQQRLPSPRPFPPVPCSCLRLVDDALRDQAQLHQEAAHERRLAGVHMAQHDKVEAGLGTRCALLSHRCRAGARHLGAGLVG